MRGGGVVLLYIVYMQSTWLNRLKYTISSLSYKLKSYIKLEPKEEEEEVRDVSRSGTVCDPNVKAAKEFKPDATNTGFPP